MFRWALLHHTAKQHRTASRPLVVWTCVIKVSFVKRDGLANHITSILLHPSSSSPHCQCYCQCTVLRQLQRTNDSGNAGLLPRRFLLQRPPPPSSSSGLLLYLYDDDDFITRGGEGPGDTSKESKATKSEGRCPEEGASLALMCQCLRVK